MPQKPVNHQVYPLTAGLQDFLNALAPDQDGRAITFDELKVDLVAYLGAYEHGEADACDLLNDEIVTTKAISSVLADLMMYLNDAV